jgi:hypothetical protein
LALERCGSSSSRHIPAVHARSRMLPPVSAATAHWSIWCSTRTARRRSSRSMRGRGAPTTPPTAKTFFMVSVAVRTRYQALPQFARDFPYRCRDGWQSTPLPRQR